MEGTRGSACARATHAPALLVVLAALAWAGTPIAVRAEDESANPGSEKRAVLVPSTVTTRAREEIARLQPGAEVVTYDPAAKTVEHRVGDVVVILVRDAPRDQRPLGRATPMAVALGPERLVYVFVAPIEEAVEHDITSSLGATALGRVIAHEVEHIRRQSGEHDREGFFRACPTRANLTDPGWR